MGYGGADGKATRTQLSNDGGIDGIIDQDALGLSRVYVQAKRYALDRSVDRPDPGVRRCSPWPADRSRSVHHHGAVQHRRTRVRRWRLDPRDLGRR
ncbi:MAG: restriction endonuclease [Actinomycetia bacterium]|nr:restriction endonuclease [Actinomycetes bacterium]